jgi:hypothetical protein
MGEVFVGIVEGKSPSEITVGVIQDVGMRVTCSSFTIEMAHLHEYYVPQPGGHYRHEMPADLIPLGSFLNKTISADSRAKYFLEVSETAPDGPNLARAVPCAVLPADAVMLKVLVLLGVNNIIVAPFRTDPQVRTAVVFPILHGGDLEPLRHRAPRYLSRGVCKAYGELLGLTCERTENVAIVGAMLAKNPGAFHFWSSIGRVQSSQDIVADLRLNISGPTSVFSGAECYITNYTPATVHDAIEDLPLEYAVTEKRYEDLGRNNSIKAALIHVCQRWRIELLCGSRRADADAPDVDYPVYPLDMSDQVLLAALQHAEHP